MSDFELGILCGFILGIGIACALRQLAKDSRDIYRISQRQLVDRLKRGEEFSLVVPACFECGKPVIASDDEALICIQCGGRNRRANRQEEV